MNIFNRCYEYYNSTVAIFLTLIVALIPLLWIYFGDTILKWLVICYKTIPRDLRGLSCLLRYKYRLWRFKKANGTIAGLFFSRTLRKWPNDIAFIFEDQSWTYSQVGQYATAVALYFYENLILPNGYNINPNKESSNVRDENQTVFSSQTNHTPTKSTKPPSTLVTPLVDVNISNECDDNLDDVSSTLDEDEKAHSTNIMETPAKALHNKLKVNIQSVPSNQSPNPSHPTHVSSNDTSGTSSIHASNHINTNNSSINNNNNSKPAPTILALFMESRPEYVCYWLGLSRIGIKCALLNNQLRGEALLNSLKALPAIRGIVYGPEMQKAIDEVKPLLAAYNNIRLYKVGYLAQPVGHNGIALISSGNNCNNNNDKDSQISSTNKKLDNIDNEHIDAQFQFGTPLPPQAIYRAKSRHEILFYIYTSGTTGMPKAAIVSHVKYLYLTYLVSRTLQIRKDDIIYTPLPLYHTAGGIVGVGQSIILGSTVVIKKKFSASAFWKDCIKYHCTVAQYIGEICRYLLARPPNPAEDRGHKVRLMYGNGLRKQIWKEFVERFGLEQVGEFYGATESNANMVNIDNTFGSVGFNSVIVPFLLPITLIKVDPDTGEPLRNPKNGLCIPCKPGEQGELVGKIIKSDPVKSFQGYSDRSATKKKIVKNVFHKGDTAFLTGDILVQDELGNYYFVDRTGDTFRWKGENVSTLEVENLMGNVLGHEFKDVVVFGVAVPGAEGKAGMAVILDPNGVLAEKFKADGGQELHHVYEELSKVLPAYAKPMFIRLTKTIDLTTTFKPKKTELIKDGFDPNVITSKSDSIFYADSSKQTYAPLTNELFKSISDGSLRL